MDCSCNGWGCRWCEADEVYDMSREREPADDTTTRLTTLLAAHATATWRSWAEDDYVDQVSATDAAYMAAGGNDAHYDAHWRALSDAAKKEARNPVTAAYQASQRQLAAAHGWPALVDV